MGEVIFSRLQRALDGTARDATTRQPLIGSIMDLSS